jgi:hypothetical protein
VAETALTAELKRFIAGYIPSLEHLEILLLLSERPSQDWTVESVYEVVKSSDTGVRKALDELTEMKLLRREGANYRYSPATEETGRLVTDLAVAYRTRRIRVVELIYSPELDALREFQRAFRFRKKEE